MRMYGFLIWGLLLSAILAAVSAVSSPHLSSVAAIAVHFDVNGNANGYMSKQGALLFGPLFVLGLTLLLTLVRKVRFNDEDTVAGQGKAFDLIGMAVLALVGASHVLILLNAQGAVKNVTGTIIPLLALFLLVMGNVLGKTRRNALIGVRTPWSLASGYSWEKANRIGGRLFFMVGLIVLIVNFAWSSAWASRALFAGVLVTAAASVFASWLYWKRDPSRPASLRQVGGE